MSKYNYVSFLIKKKKYIYNIYRKENNVYDNKLY